MELLREYATGIIVVSVLAILLENLLAETHNKKYINVALGLVVMLVIVNPLTKLPHYRDAFVLPELLIDDSDLSQNSEKQLVQAEFARRLAERLSEETKQRCGKQVAVRVFVDSNENGEITGIRKIAVSPLDEEIRAALAESSGVEISKIEEG